MTLSVRALYVYPIKSAAGAACTAVRLTPQGLAFDRVWMVVDDQGRLVTQRERPGGRLTAKRDRGWEQRRERRGVVW